MPKVKRVSRPVGVRISEEARDLLQKLGEERGWTVSQACDNVVLEMLTGRKGYGIKPVAR